MRIDIDPTTAVSGSGDGTPPPLWTMCGAHDTSVLRSLQRRSRRPPEFVKLLQGIYDALLITDSLGRVVDFNGRALDFFRCDEESMAGVSVIELISGADNALLDAVQTNLANHRYTLIEARCLRSDQTSFPAEIAVNRVDLDAEGQLCFFVRDITARKAAQEALESAVARLKAHDDARLQFISNVSHELRTPLTSMIYAVANMLRGVVGPIPERARSYLEMLDADCRRLLGTVNDILDMRKIEDRSIELNRTKAPVVPLVRRSVESLAVLARQKQHVLTVTSDEGNRFFFCDAPKMERVVLNVVGNALKFTGEGGSIEVDIRDDPEREGHVRIAVSDNGIGIPAEALARVTERFFTVGAQPSGSGLGLAISKEIVALHEGTLEIVSPPPGRERGTLVAVSLPTIPAPIVLVVDDDPAVTALLTGQVREWGFQPAAAATGVEALELMRHHTPDVVVTDIALPEMDGVEFILKLKSERQWSRLPVVVVSGVRPSPGKEGILNGLGIPRLPKPWSEAALRDCLYGLFLGSGTLARLPSARLSERKEGR